MSSSTSYVNQHLFNFTLVCPHHASPAFLFVPLKAHYHVFPHDLWAFDVWPVSLPLCFRLIHCTWVYPVLHYPAFFGYYFFNMMLLVLQCLHIFWAYLILCMVRKFITGSVSLLRKNTIGQLSLPWSLKYSFGNVIQQFLSYSHHQHCQYWSFVTALRMSHIDGQGTLACGRECATGEKLWWCQINLAQ